MDIMLGRIIERIIIAIAGMLCMVLGYRLFRTATEKQGQLEIQRNEKVKLSFGNVAPGVWFAFFGAALLGFALYQRASVADEPPPSLKTVGIVHDTIVVPRSSAGGTDTSLQIARGTSANGTHAPDTVWVEVSSPKDSAIRRSYYLLHTPPVPDTARRPRLSSNVVKITPMQPAREVPADTGRPATTTIRPSQRIDPRKLILKKP